MVHLSRVGVARILSVRTWHVSTSPSPPYNDCQHLSTKQRELNSNGLRSERQSFTFTQFHTLLEEKIDLEEVGDGFVRPFKLASHTLLAMWLPIDVMMTTSSGLKWQHPPQHISFLNLHSRKESNLFIFRSSWYNSFKISNFFYPNRYFPVGRQNSSCTNSLRIIIFNYIRKVLILSQ